MKRPVVRIIEKATVRSVPGDCGCAATWSIDVLFADGTWKFRPGFSSWQDAPQLLRDMERESNPEAA